MWVEFSAAGLACTLEEAREESFVFRCGKCRKVEVLEAQLAAIKIELEEARDRAAGSAAVVSEGEDSVGQAEGEQEGAEDEGRQRGTGGSLGEDREEHEWVRGQRDADIESVVGEETAREDRAQRSGEGEGSRGEMGEVHREAVVIGSSIVRKTDRVFCGADREHRVRVCLPGAKIRDVEERIEAVVGSSGGRPKVIVQVGTNDLSDRDERGERIGTEGILGRFQRLVGKVAQLDCDAMVMGILPRLRMSGWEASRICGINRRLGALCQQWGVAFRDVWEDFAGKGEMFAWDGLHPSQRGGNRLGQVYSEWVQQQGN